MTNFVDVVINWRLRAGATTGQGRGGETETSVALPSSVCRGQRAGCDFRRSNIVPRSDSLARDSTYVGGMTDRSGSRTGRNWGVGVALGVGVGVAFGVALDNLWIGIALGAALFPAFAMAQGPGDERPADDGNDQP